MYYLKQSVTGYVEKNRGECLYAAQLYETQHDLDKKMTVSYKFTLSNF
jgi:hypothetical protein